MGVEREVSREGQVVVAHEREALALLAEACVLEGQERGDRVAIVDTGEIDVFAPDPGHSECEIRGDPDGGFEKVARVGGGLDREPLAAACDDDGAMRRRLRAVGAGDHECMSARDRHHDLEQVERVGDHATGEDVVVSDRLAVKDGVRVRAGVRPLIDRDLRHRAFVVSVHCAVALGDHRVAGVLRQVAVGDLELGLGRAVGVRAGPVDPAIVEGLVGTRVSGRRARGDRADDDVAEPELDRRGGAPDHADRVRTAEVDLLREVHLEAEILGDRRGDEAAGLGDHRGHEPVDLRRLDSGVREGKPRELGDLLEHGYARPFVLPLGLPVGHPDDCCFASQSHASSSLRFRASASASRGACNSARECPRGACRDRSCMSRSQGARRVRRRRAGRRSRGSSPSP